MRHKIKLILILVFVWIFIFPIFAKDFRFISEEPLTRPPEPHLVYPVSEKVILSGDYLEFKWWNTFRGIGRYEFRLYRGYEMYQPNLMEKQILSFNASSIKISSDKFENNQVYTWSLIPSAEIPVAFPPKADPPLAEARG
jgi:hypothetical protein